MLSESFPYFFNLFSFNTALDIAFVRIESLAGIGTGDLNIRHSRKYHQQVPSLDFNIRVRQNRNICQLNHIEDKIFLADLQAIFRKGFYAEQVLNRFTFMSFVFLLFCKESTN